MSDREDIAAAANAVAGINVYPGFRESTKIGDGWMKLIGMTPQTFGYIREWMVVIVIPNQVTGAEEWMDTNLEAIADALSRQLEITKITPTAVPLSESGTVYAVAIQGVR